VLPSYDIKYSYQSMIWSMVSQSKKFYATYRKEKVLIASLVETHGVDIIVSDNRFGCNHPKVHNIYITHQLNIVPPLEIVGFIANSIHHFFIGKYDEVWVPDTADHAYSGTLSQVRMQKNLKYIGPLSRLKLKLDKIKDIDIAIILSGPEPQRTILEQLLLSEIDKIEKTMVLIRGSKDLTSTHPKHISIINVADQAQMEDTLSRSRIIICRSGYSSIMDLLHLQAEIIFIPTPGQTEQEYLAEFHSTRYKNVHSMKQNEIKSKLIKLIDSLG
jgi:UDP-N-acetylglucosamine transferase subunit ALG13